MFLFILQHDNVNSCLTTLRTHSVGGLDSITTSDICSGRLKAVLALFFALSRYKQASKQKLGVSVKQPQHHIPVHNHLLQQQQQLQIQQQQQQIHHPQQQPVTQHQTLQHQAQVHQPHHGQQPPVNDMLNR